MRILAVLSVLPSLVGLVGAQCAQTTGGVAAGLLPTYTYPAADEGRSPPIDMLFGPAGFPMAGAAGPLTHVVVGSNGELYLTSGGPPVHPIDFGAVSLGQLRGIVGASPRVWAFSTDLEGLSPAWAVTVDTSVAGRCKVNWIDVEQFASGGPRFAFSAALFASGTIELSYGTMPALAPGFAGVSIGNAVGTGFETPVDFTAGPDSGGLGMIFQQMNGTDVPSFSQRTIALVPNLLGGYFAVVTCAPANHEVYGVGCHDHATETCYQVFADAVAASSALQGNALVWSPLANGYVTNWVPGGASLYLAPTGLATSLPADDNGSTVVMPPLPLPIPGGTATALTVGHNGIVTIGPVANNDLDLRVTGPEVAAAPHAAFYSSSDFRDTNTIPVPSGRIKTETLGGVFCITWDGVDHWASPQVSCPSTFQFQFDLTTGVVTLVWVTIDTNTTNALGTEYLVGCTGPGPGLDPGPVSLSAGPIVTAPDLRAMTLAAAPAPVINPSTVVTYTVGEVPEFAPGSGVYLSTIFLSLNPNPSGFDLLGILTTVPGCNAWISTLDLGLGAQAALQPTAVWNVTFSNLFFAPGDVIAAQAVALFDGASPLANGESGGFLFSNGVRSLTAPF